MDDGPGLRPAAETTRERLDDQEYEPDADLVEAHADHDEDDDA
jgi:hypothetical protein